MRQFEQRHWLEHLIRVYIQQVVCDVNARHDCGLLKLEDTRQPDNVVFRTAAATDNCSDLVRRSVP